MSDRSLFFSGDREVCGLTRKIFKRTMAIASLFEEIRDSGILGDGFLRFKIIAFISDIPVRCDRQKLDFSIKILLYSSGVCNAYARIT
ncbi:MAG: hypothetical protein V7K76_24500 [Nostoc sp.]|uniref:hypothetical protein n=1 Tax=Nostoc sp. TaxID=1180 RepID=UPI002FFB13EC